MFVLNQKEIETKLDAFIWDFKVGDNIKHNLEESFFLYKIKKENCSKIKEEQFLNKHISLTLVAIIEGVLYDFVVRLSEATNHFPSTIDEKKRKEIKADIAKRKVSYEAEFGKILRVKNYSLSQIFALLEKYELLGKKQHAIYKALKSIIHFRNRIHIYNWYKNFEVDEKYVFTNKRLEILEQILIYILGVMETKYARP